MFIGRYLISEYKQRFILKNMFESPYVTWVVQAFQSEVGSLAVSNIRQSAKLLRFTCFLIILREKV